MDIINDLNIIEADIEDTKKNVIKFNVIHCRMHSMQLLNYSLICSNV